ncbi:uncharacterized protein (DUF2249 family) [Azospirillum agricola]|uniref:DUF2249 domain-containing protein n=1 Tax=Azospirillum agricola TaxID=1720247 RepID=UPI001F298878|nr:DUF2249 domain-containing protein [Azospirillum agricola]MBP2229481.1 uncharacterized protein (DUF2249 family) [Azospirillum agricola]
MHSTLPSSVAMSTVDASSVADEPVVDVQSIPPYERHPLIFQRVQALAPGAGFSLVNDHDPRPLHRQLETLFGEAIAWEYLERGPAVWRVRISRPLQPVPPAAFRLRIAQDGGVTLAAADAQIGPAAGGALVCDVTDCPPAMSPETVIDLMRGVVPPAGQWRIPFERLVARRNGSCCGGMCGG